MKSILLGMNNPLSRLPENALFPYPPGCSGHRLWMMLRQRVPNATRLDYLQGFDRINLVNDVRWNPAAARRAAARLPSLYAGRTIVVLGDACRKMIGLPKKLVHPVHMHGIEWRQLPHPSGRCLWYNDPHCRELAAVLLEELYLKGRGE